MKPRLLLPWFMTVVALPLRNLLINELPAARDLLPRDAGVANHSRNDPVIDEPPHQQGRPHQACVALIRTINGPERNQGGTSAPAPPPTLPTSTPRNISRRGLLRRLPSDELSDASRSKIVNCVISTTDVYRHLREESKPCQI